MILITGAAGFIGVKLAETLAGDYRVIGLDVKRPAQAAPFTEFLDCDLTNDESVGAALAGLRRRFGDRIASVLHLAAYYDFSGRPSELYRTLTVEGTRRLLRELQAFTVEQFVFSSTLLVVKPAESEDEVLTERTPVETEETWDYPRSKIEAERVIRRERGQIPAVILRIAGVYDESCDSIPIAQQIARIYEKRLESYLFPGDADHGQAFVHLDDLAECFRRVVELRRELGACELFLVAEPEVMSYAELQECIGELVHARHWPTIRIPKLVAKAGAWVRQKMAGESAFIQPWMIDLADTHYPVAIGRARERLGWNPTRRLRDTLPEMIARLRRDPRGWYAANKLPWPEARQAAASRR